MNNPVNHLFRSYFANMFERHDYSRFGRHSYGVLDQAIISLDSIFSVEASFFEVWRGLIDTPRTDWRFERVIFCLEDKDKKNRSSEFDRKNEYFVLPAEAMVNILSDEAPREVTIQQIRLQRHATHIFHRLSCRSISMIGSLNSRIGKFMMI